MLEGKGSGGMLRGQDSQRNAQRVICSVAMMQEGTLEEGCLKIWMFEEDAWREGCRSNVGKWGCVPAGLCKPVCKAASCYEELVKMGSGFPQGS